jgi:nickel transport system permease protein
MRSLILKRLLLMPFLLVAVSIVTFVLMHLSPSDPAEVALRINDITPTPEAILQMRGELGLDRPVIERYVHWLEGIAQGDFGLSYETKMPVFEELSRAFPTTLCLAFFAFVLVVVFGVALGIACALFEGSAFDVSVRGIVFVVSAIPSFLAGLVFIWVLALVFDLFPTGGLETKSGFVLPVITLALPYIATYVRLMRNALVENREALFVLYAQVRGVSRYALLKHRIRNALQPFIVALGMSVPKLLAGTVVVENVFGLPGLGRLCVHAIFSRDYPMIQAYVLLMALLFIVSNAVADLGVYASDPRLRRRV